MRDEEVGEVVSGTTGGSCFGAGGTEGGSGLAESGRLARSVEASAGVASWIGLWGVCTKVGRDGAPAPSPPRSAAQRDISPRRICPIFRPLNAGGDAAGAASLPKNSVFVQSRLWSMVSVGAGLGGMLAPPIEGGLEG